MGRREPSGTEEPSLSPPVEELFPSRPVREELDALLSRELAESQELIARGSVTPTIDLDAFRTQLAAYDFETKQPAQAILSWVISSLQQGVVHLNHPRYFGLFNPAPSFPSQMADRVAGAFNPQLASTGSSPVAVAIEAHVIKALAIRAGLPEGAGGHFTTSGSEANYTALVCALTRAHADFGTSGVRAFPGPVAIYTSRECQPAWHKIAHHAGIGRAALRLIETDGCGRMDVAALDAAIGDDRRNGVIPVMITPTAGTTNAGMVDPLAECASIAREQGIWYHIDAAWGGAALCSARLRPTLDGIETADSLTIDAHKWFATTMGCGMFITRHPEVLSEAFRVQADFMPSNLASQDPYLTTLQWSRRFMGLRLFLSLAIAGWQGYAAHVERAVEVIALVRTRLMARGWSVLNDSQLAVLCAVPPAGSAPVAVLIKRLLASGRAWAAAARFEGHEVVRICATHGAISLADIEELVAALEAAR